jgi:hypothetical protein
VHRNIEGNCIQVAKPKSQKMAQFSALEAERFSICRARIEALPKREREHLFFRNPDKHFVSEIAR